ncbi:MAG TPA: histidine kinase dimerization/phospho-acceptor domain-containing protein, partial [Rhizomicrobium sp.]|nr:histidine kinase dimerization/phospho-acceptor domain-containing protein [Rhizomicrobium sp.]
MRRFRSISMLVTIITAGLVVVLVSIFAWQVMAARQQQREAARIKTQVKIARDTVSVREALRAELGVIGLATAADQPVSPQTLAQLRTLHARSSAALQMLETELNQNSAGPGGAGKILIAHAKYNALFPRVLAMVRQPRALRPSLSQFDPGRSIFEVVAAIDDQSVELSRDIASVGPFMSEMIKVSDIAWFVRSYAGNDRRTTSLLIGQNRAPSRSDLDHLAHVRGAIDGPWQFIGMAARRKDFPSELLKSVKEAEQIYFVRYRALQEKLLGQLKAGQGVAVSESAWLAMTKPGLDSLMMVSRTALDIAGAQAQTHEKTATREFYEALLLMLASIGLASLGAVYVIFRVVRPLRRITAALDAFNAGARPQAIAFDAREDEIGQFSRALNRFQKNVAEKKALEIEVMRKNVEKEAAVNSSRIKSEFLANMSHELRTPLNAVIGFSDIMLHKTFGPLNERYQEYARLINESGTHLLNLVSDILDLAKVEAGKLVLDVRDLDLG